jgi:hypothetical protein
MVVVLSNPLDGISRVDTRNDGEATEHSPGPAEAAITRNLHKFTGARSAVKFTYEIKDVSFVFRHSKVGPCDQFKWPRHLRIRGPSVIQIHSEVRSPTSFCRNQIESSPSEHDRVIWKSDDHE